LSFYFFQSGCYTNPFIGWEKGESITLASNKLNQVFWQKNELAFFVCSVGKVVSDALALDVASA
jgi:hypothetical protein